MQNMNDTQLRAMADELKADAKALFRTDKAEAMNLFRLFRKIVEEIYRRRGQRLNHFWQWN